MTRASDGAGLVEGKVALVTGAASGIGRASARAFAREGARVMLADLDEKGGEETASIIMGSSTARTTTPESPAALARCTRSTSTAGSTP